jgi:hypothetical protein
MSQSRRSGIVVGIGSPLGASAREVAIEAAPGVVLWGDLLLPRGGSSRGVVVLPGGLGASRVTPGNGRTAQVFNDAGIATLRLGLLTAVEEGYLAGRGVTAPRTALPPSFCAPRPSRVRVSARCSRAVTLSRRHPGAPAMAYHTCC